MGVVGCGYFGRFHVEKYLKMEGVELVGAVDVDPARSREIEKQYRIPSYSRHSDLFGKVQSVSIAVPTPLHHSIARDFFLRDIDVLLEKPIASTLEEADELIALAESRALILQVGHLERFNGAFLAAEGKIRHPFFIESQRLGPFTGRGADVDVVLDLMVHDIDIVLSLVPSGLKDLDAIGLPVLTPRFDVANVRMVFENGCRANLTASRVSMERVRQARVFQPDGTWTIDFLSQKTSSSKRVIRPEKGDKPEMLEEEIPVTKVDLLQAEIRSFLGSVRDRSRAKVSGREGRSTLEVALRIVREMGERRYSKA